MATGLHGPVYGRGTAQPAPERGIAAFGAYLAEFLKDPRRVGSPIPSFVRTVDRLLDPIDWSGVDLLVELGPGTGRFTAGALNRMRPDAKLIAIDASPGFIQYLQKAIRDPRLIAVAALAQDIEDVVSDCGFAQCDCILSGLPFSTLEEGEGEAIMEASHRILRPKGIFAAYQVRDHILGLLQRDFTMIGEAYEWLNLPPYHLYWFGK